MAEFDQIRLGSPFGREAVPSLSRQTSESSILRSADCLVAENKQLWWPRSASLHGIKTLLNELGQALDLSGSVLIVGNGALARATAVAMVQLGFKNFQVTGRSKSRVEDMLSQLRQTFFGVHYAYVAPESLVRLPGDSSILVNTTPIVADNELLPELSYLNFLRREGWVWDLALNREETALLKEAGDLNLNRVSGYQLAAFSDAEWVRWCTGKKYLSHPDLRPVTKNVTPV